MDKIFHLSELAEVNPPRRTLSLNESDEVSFITMSDVTDNARWINKQARKFKDVKHGYTYFEEGDILFAKITPCMENGKGCFVLNLKNGVGFGSTEFHILRAKINNDPRFIFQLCISNELRKKATLQMIGSAGQQRVPASFLANFPIPNFTKSEQSKIADILTTIDKAIAQTETLIAKYKRVKTGLMQDLLTRGIDEHGQLRDPSTHKFKRSPLGMIPDEWDVGSLGRITDLQVGYAFKSKDFLDNGVRLLRGENVGYGEADWSDSKYVLNNLVKYFEEYTLQEGDIVIGMDRTFTKQGCKISVLKKEDTPALLVQRVGRFITQSDIKNFLKVILYSPMFQAELQKKEKGMDIPHLSKEEILNVLICIPPKKEMIKISSITACINKRIYITKLNLHKLQKIKIGLMQDLLTGKISVKPLLTNEP